MPDRSKVRWSQLKVGVVAVTALIILGVLIFLLTSTQGRLPAQRAAAHLHGRRLGHRRRHAGAAQRHHHRYLEGLRLTNSRDRNRTVEFDMKVEPKYLREIPVDSVAGIGAANLLGDKFINITKGAQHADTCRTGAELSRRPAQDIPELMAQSANLLQSLQTIVNRAGHAAGGRGSRARATSASCSRTRNSTTG